MAALEYRPGNHVGTDGHVEGFLPGGLPHSALIDGEGQNREVERHGVKLQGRPYQTGHLLVVLAVIGGMDFGEGVTRLIGGGEGESVVDSGHLVGGEGGVGRHEAVEQGLVAGGVHRDIHLNLAVVDGPEGQESSYQEEYCK